MRKAASHTDSQDQGLVLTVTFPGHLPYFPAMTGLPFAA